MSDFSDSDQSNSTTDPFESIPTVILEHGVGKYVQIRLTSQNETMLVIRQDTKSEYHKEVAQSTINDARSKGIKAAILGGGRISYDQLNNKMFIYGYSMQYGRPDHCLTAGIIQASLPNIEITWSNEGY